MAQVYAGWDREAKEVRYERDEVGDFRTVTKEQYFKELADPNYVNPIDNPSAGGAKRLANKNPWEAMSTADIKKAIATSRKAMTTLQFDRVKKAAAINKKTGLAIDAGIFTANSYKILTVDGLTQFPRSILLEGLTEGQKGYLVEDIQRMGPEKALGMALIQGGQGHHDWLLSFIEDQALSPPMTMKQTMNDLLHQNAEGSARRLGEKKMRGDLTREPSSGVDVQPDESGRVESGGPGGSARQGERERALTATDVAASVFGMSSFLGGMGPSKKPAKKRAKKRAKKNDDEKNKKGLSPKGEAFFMRFGMTEGPKRKNK